MLKWVVIMQPVPSFIATGAAKSSQLPAKRKAVGVSSGAENLKIKHFFAPSR